MRILAFKITNYLTTITLYTGHIIDEYPHAFTKFSFSDNIIALNLDYCIYLYNLNILPINLIRLTLHHSFSPFMRGYNVRPDSLTELSLFYNEDEPLTNIMLPRNLERLVLSSDNIIDHEYPISLRELTFRSYYITDFDYLSRIILYRNYISYNLFIPDHIIYINIIELINNYIIMLSPMSQLKTLLCRYYTAELCIKLDKLLILDSKLHCNNFNASLRYLHIEANISNNIPYRMKQINVTNNRKVIPVNIAKLPYKCAVIYGKMPEWHTCII